jgi:hypothetical protein
MGELARFNMNMHSMLFDLVARVSVVEIGLWLWIQFEEVVITTFYSETKGYQAAR